MAATNFDDSLAAAFAVACPNGICAGVLDVTPVLSGQMTAEELAMIYGEAL